MKTQPTLLLDIKYTDKAELNDNLPKLREKIIKILEKIKKLETYEEAEYYFALLGEIQNILAKLVFANNFIATDEILKFIGDFDRIDDLSHQKYLFNKIKSNLYCLSRDF